MKCCNAVRQHATSSITASRPHITPFLWISDQQIDEAFARFVTVSKTFRRHGSNVPGPLEARRRQGRRRMAFATGGIYDGPNLAEFGTLFGAGEQKTGIFQWEPPAKSVDINAESNNFWERLGTQRREEKPTMHVQLPLSSAQPALEIAVEGQLTPFSPPETFNCEQDNVQTSKLAFNVLLDTYAGERQLSAADVAPLISFLESSKDEPGAHNTEALLRWLRDRTFTTEAYLNVCRLVLSKHQLGTMSTAEFGGLLKHVVKQAYCSRSRSTYLEVLAMLSSHFEACFAGTNNATKDLADAYHQSFECIRPLKASFPEVQLALEALLILAPRRDATNIPGAFVARAMVYILEKQPQGPMLSVAQNKMLHAAWVKLLNTSKEKHLAPRLLSIMLFDAAHADTWYMSRIRVTYFLRRLHESDRLLKTQKQEDLLDNWAAYWVVARRYHQISFLSKHLATLSHLQLATALLNGMFRAGSLVYDHSLSDPWTKFKLDREQMALFNELQYSNICAIQNPLISLLLRAKKYAWNYPIAVKTIARVLEVGCSQDQAAERRQGHVRRRLAFHKALKVNRLSIPGSVEVATIRLMLQNNHSTRAMRLFLDLPDLPLSLVLHLPGRLLRDGIDPAYILDVIKATLVERRARGVQALTQNIVDFIHQLAVAESYSDKHSPRTAFDRVWRCYQFLVQRSIPYEFSLDSRISKALTQSGIIRALQSRSCLPDARLHYILNLVRKYEGDAVADELNDHVRRVRDRLKMDRREPIQLRAPLEQINKSGWKRRVLPNF